MTDNVLHWIRLQCAIGAGNPRSNLVAQIREAPAHLFELSEQELTQMGFLRREAERIRTSTVEQAQRIAERAQKLRCRIVTPSDEQFPENLRHIEGIPCVLYVLGPLAVSEEMPMLTLVGTRKSTPDGIKAAQWIAGTLAAVGCTIVSGLAVGIDAASHWATLQAHGRAIGLLGCGMDVGYPAENARLKRAILNGGGTLVTEYPFGTSPYPTNFPRRNRLMSGLADGVVVVQAGRSSGALSTASHAVRQGKDVFALPGEALNASMEGCNRLIADGCKMVLGAGSVLEDYLLRFPALRARLEQMPSVMEEPVRENLPRARMTKKPDSSESPTEGTPCTIAPLAAPVERASSEQLAALGVSELGRTLYAVLERVPTDCDQLAMRTGMTTSALMAGLTELEMQDLAVCLPGKRYALRTGSGSCVI